MITPTPPVTAVPDALPVRALPEVAPKLVAEATKITKEPVKEDEGKSEPAKRVGASRQPVPAYDLRLTVEKDAETGEVVYKSINRLTGEVVKQMPNAEVMAMKRREQYQAGSIFITDV